MPSESKAYRVHTEECMLTRNYTSIRSRIKKLSFPVFLFAGYSFSLCARANQYDLVIDADTFQSVILSGTGKSLRVNKDVAVRPADGLYDFAVGGEKVRNWKIVNEGYIEMDHYSDGVGIRLQGGDSEIINSGVIYGGENGILVGPDSMSLPRDDDRINIENLPGGLIRGDKSPVSITGSADIFNQGEISGGNIGVFAAVRHGGRADSFTLFNNGLISGKTESLLLAGYQGSGNRLTNNEGSILSHYGDGIALRDMSDVMIENFTGAQITGLNRGIYSSLSYGSFLTLFNSGTVSGTKGAGASVFSSAIIENTDSGVIEGAGGMVLGAEFNQRLTNRGIIQGHATVSGSGSETGYDFGSGAGIYIADASPEIFNAGDGLISGGVYGIYQSTSDGTHPFIRLENLGTIYGGDTGISADRSDSMEIVNAGTIEGGKGTAILFSQDKSHNTSTLTLKTGSNILGKVTGPAWGDSALMLQGRGEQDMSGFSQMSYVGIMSPGDRWRLTGNGRFTGNATSTYSGMSTDGTLILDGDFVTTHLDVRSTGELTGGGSLTGNVFVYGGELTGRQGQTLNIFGDLTMWGGNINVALGSPGDNGLFNVSGDLQLGGELNVSDLGGFGPGVYRLFDYGLSFSDYGLSIAGTPDGISRDDLSLQTSVDKQINLINTAGMNLGFWAGQEDSVNGVESGGDGIWDVSSPHWTDADGTLRVSWRGEFAVFQGAAGHVQTDNSAGEVGIRGMQFVTNGYRISGEPITFLEDNTIIRVGNGRQNAADITAILDSALTGAGGLTKTDLGTLVLNAASDYSGRTDVKQGALIIGDESHSEASVRSQVHISPDALLGGYGAISGNVDNGGTILTGSRSPGSGMPSTLRITGDLTNAGLIRLDNGKPGNVLAIGGNYHGRDGLLSLNVRLGADDSASDRLLIEGSTSGTTQVTVINAGGSGASTLNGIELIRVNGESAGEFRQSGRIVAGAYDYRLVRGKADLSGNWYLSNARGDSGGSDGSEKPDPAVRVVRAEAGAYTANFAAANTLFPDVPPESRDGDSYHRQQGFWLQSSAGRQRWGDSTGQTDTRAYRTVTRTGVDLLRPAENVRAGLTAGVARQRGMSDSHVSNATARSSIRGYNVGAYGYRTQNTGESGPLFSAGVGYSWFSNSVQGDTLRPENYGSRGFSASAGAGYSWAVTGPGGSALTLQPEARISWMNVKSDDLREHNGTRVRSRNEGNVQTKAGIKLLYSHPETSAVPYAEAAWRHQPRPFGTQLDDVEVMQGGTRDVGEIRAGISGNLTENVMIWGDLTHQTGSRGFSDSLAVAGLRVSF
jgi:autotransporter family porin